MGEVYTPGQAVYLLFWRRPEESEVTRVQIFKSKRRRDSTNIDLLTWGLITLTATWEIPTPVKESSMEEVVRVTAKVYELEYEDLIGRSRKLRYAEARQMAMYILRSTEEYSLAAVGMGLGGRSPATVSHAYSKVYTSLQVSLTKRNLVKEIHLRLGIIEREKK